MKQKTILFLLILGLLGCLTGGLVWAEKGINVPLVGETRSDSAPGIIISPPPTRQLPPIKTDAGDRATDSGSDATSKKTSKASVVTIPAEKNSSGKPSDPSNELIKIDFTETKLIDVIKAIGVRTNKNFYVDPNLVQQEITVISHAGIPADAAYEVLESILSMHNMALVPTIDGNLIRVVEKTKDNDKHEVFTGIGNDIKGYDTISTHIVPIENADATELSLVLKSVASEVGRVDVYAPTNTLILTDTADGIRNMFKILKVMDVPGYDTTMEIFLLEYTTADVMQQQIEEVLLTTDPQQPGPNPSRPLVSSASERRERRRAQQQNPAAQTSQVIGSREDILRMVTDERLNALIVVASESMMGQVRDLIDQLDTPTPSESNNLHIYELLNADVKEVADALKELVGAAVSKRTQQKGEEQQADIQPFENQVIITSYEGTNALLIMSTPQDYRRLENIIALLDVPRRQVVVDAIIMEVAINNACELGVEWTALGEKDFLALNNVVNLANMLAGGVLAGAGPGLTIAALDGTTEITLPGSVDAEGNITGTTIATIPNVPLLLKALETITDLDVLSQPTLTTMDNEEAKIVVGQEIPVVSSLSDVNDQTGFQSRTRVERVDVGVKLTVTPQINEGDYVRLETEVEVSQPIASSVGIDPNQVGATFQKSQTQCKVIVKDGSTGLIGGLLSESSDRTIRQTPILGDVPMLGWLFRSKGNSRIKRNLVVLLTPHIVKEGTDLDKVTDYKLDRFSDANIDVLFEKNFITKIKKKHQLRNQYKPSGEKLETLQSKQDFGRGDMRR